MAALLMPSALIPFDISARPLDQIGGLPTYDALQERGYLLLVRTGFQHV